MTYLEPVGTPESDPFMKQDEPYNLRYKPVTTAPKTPNDSQERDQFETPSYAVDILVPFIPKNITHIWECACGGGKIVNRLISAGYTVSGSDIRDEHPFNFITQKLGFTLSNSWAIITNPPFSIKELFIEKAFEYGVPFAFLINMDYSGQSIKWIERECEKIIPKNRIAFITPRIVQRVNDGEGTNFQTKDEIPSQLIYKYSSAQFHSGWLCYKFNLGKSETFVDLPIEVRKNNI